MTRHSEDGIQHLVTAQKDERASLFRKAANALLGIQIIAAQKLFECFILNKREKIGSIIHAKVCNEPLHLINALKELPSSENRAGPA